MREVAPSRVDRAAAESSVRGQRLDGQLKRGRDPAEDGVGGDTYDYTCAKKLTNRIEDALRNKAPLTNRIEDALRNKALLVVGSPGFLPACASWEG